MNTVLTCLAHVAATVLILLALHWADRDLIESETRHDWP